MNLAFLGTGFIAHNHAQEILKMDEKTESRSLDRFRITVYTMEHGKRLGREQVDVQKRGQKAAGR